MADLLCIAATEGEVALVGGAAKTVLQIAAPANQRVRILGWGVFFDGTSVTAEPCQAVLARQTTAGTSTGVTPKKLGTQAETVQTTAGKACTVEPTTTDEVDSIECHPQQGYEKIYPLGQEIKVAGGGRLGIVVTAPAAVNCRAKILFEE